MIPVCNKFVKFIDYNYIMIPKEQTTQFVQAFNYYKVKFCKSLMY